MHGYTLLLSDYYWHDQPHYIQLASFMAGLVSNFIPVFVASSNFYWASVYKLMDYTFMLCMYKMSSPKQLHLVYLLNIVELRFCQVHLKAMNTQKLAIWLSIARQLTTISSWSNCGLKSFEPFKSSNLTITICQSEILLVRFCLMG